MFFWKERPSLMSLILNSKQECITLEQECIPVECLPSAAAICLGVVCLGVSAQGRLPDGVSAHALGQTPPPCGQIDRCLWKYYLATTTLLMVIRVYHVLRMGRLHVTNDIGLTLKWIFIADWHDQNIRSKVTDPALLWCRRIQKRR